MLRDRRRDIHARIVEVMEELYAERLGEQIERLAHHAVRGELREKSVHYLREAGGKAAARSALADARTWFEEALRPSRHCRRPATLEQGFEIRLELRPVLRQLGEGQQMLEHLRDAEALATQLKDDRRLGLVSAFMVTVHSSVDQLDEALATGARALEIAERLGDKKLRCLATSYLEQAYCYRGEYRRAVELATDNLAALPADWNNEYLGMSVPASVFARAWLIMSLAELGRFAEAAKYETEVIRIAEPTGICLYDRLGPFRRQHAPAPQRRLDEGAFAGRTLDRDDPDRKCRHPPAVGDCLVRLGAGPDRRNGRGVEPGPGGRATPRASGGARDRRPSRLGLSRRRSRLPAAWPA